MTDIFLGLTPAAARSYLNRVYGKLYRSKYRKLVFPCIGRFTAVESAIQAGWDPKVIEASDISLFTSMLGVLAQDGNIKSLNVRFGERFEHLQGKLKTKQAVGTIMYVMKLCQLRREKIFERVVIDELEADPDVYIKQMSKKAWALAQRMEGITYQPRDMMDHIAKASKNSTTILYVNPPFWDGGYEKMWSMIGTDILWDAPDVPYFKVATQIDKLYDLLLNAKALTLFYRYADNGSGLGEMLEGHAVFANQAGGRHEYICTNRPDELDMIVQPQGITIVEPAPIPLLPRDYEITEQSTAGIVQCTKGQALYYRDLFAHKLGVVRSEQYFLVLIDGYVMGVFGMMFDRVLGNKNGEVFEVFGFNVPSDKHKRLNRLLMTVIMSEDARRYYQSFCPNSLREVDYFKTTCIATVPEVKANRGLLKVLDRKQRPDGRYHISYGGDFKPWSYQDAVRDWLQRMKSQQKATGQDLGVAA